MKKHSKRYQQNATKLEANRTYSVKEALQILANSSRAKFDETVELTGRLGVDPKKSDQMVRGTVVLPHGTGKKVRVLALVDEKRITEAKEAGADYAGLTDYITKISEGWTDFDVVVTTPANLKEVARLGKILGPRGLMPSPKTGTVTDDIGKAIRELKAGRIEFRMDKGGNLHIPVGKISFPLETLEENIKAAKAAIAASQPASFKGGQFIKSFYLSTTMGVGIPVTLE